MSLIFEIVRWHWKNGKLGKVSFSIFKGNEVVEGLKRVKDLCFIELSTNLNPPKSSPGSNYWLIQVCCGDEKKKNGFPLLSLDSWRHKSLPPWAICWVISQQWMPINCIWELRWYIHYIHYRIWESIILQWDQHNSRLWHIRYLGNLLYCDNILFHW